jgi:hypothetical protein
MTNSPALAERPSTAKGGVAPIRAPVSRTGASDAAAAARPACAIVFTPDQTYLFPSLIGAIQARRFASRDKADVLICHFGVSSAARDAFAPVCEAEGIRLMAVDPRTVDGAGAVTGRLLLNRFIPDQYTQYLYADGDVQIARSLDPLIDAEVPAGRFLAAYDPIAFTCPDRFVESQALTRHMHMIGFDPVQTKSYFNTGVLRMGRAGWDDIGTRAWIVSRDNPGKFRFADQDPLNMVAADHCIPMSLSWNFPIFMRNARVEARIAPAIYHFMSAPKPWQGAFAPWGIAGFRHYLDAVARYPALAPYNPALPLRRRARYRLQQIYKMAVETCCWGLGERHDRILEYEARTSLLERNHAPR